MKIIITESQYKLLTEREDEKNIQEVDEIYDLFVDKINAHNNYVQSRGDIKVLQVRLDTKFGELFIFLRSDSNGNAGGEYRLPTVISPSPIIIIYDCYFIGEDVLFLHKVKTIQHEIVHFIDDRKKRIKPIKVSKYETNPLGYHNDTHEINAEFIAIINQIIIRGDTFNTFAEFLKLFIEYDEMTIKQFAYLTDKNRKSLINRLYQYYTNLKKK